MRRVLALAALALIVTSATVAFAHLGSRKYVRVDPIAGGALVEVEVEAVDASMELDLGEDVNLDALRARGPAIQRWIQEGVTLTSGGGDCTSEADAPSLTVRDETDFVLVVLHFECPSDEGLVLTDDTIFPDDPQHEAMVRIAFGSDEDAHVLRRGSRELPIEPVSTATVAGVFLWEGVLHFAFGFDHVLFLLSLVLAAGFVSRKDGLKKAFKDVAILVTAFTIGHSVTLIIAALGYVVLPSQPVEIVIAASIAIVAGLNIVRPEQRGPLPWLAGGFGLIHGFGFSSVLAELGLPSEQNVLALICFNVGIELAQLAFVAVVMGPIAFLAKTKGYRRFVQIASVLIGLLALFWVVERVMG